MSYAIKALFVVVAFLIAAGILVAALWPLWVALAAIKYVFGG